MSLHDEGELNEGETSGATGFIPLASEQPG